MTLRVRRRRSRLCLCEAADTAQCPERFARQGNALNRLSDLRMRKLLEHPPFEVTQRLRTGKNDEVLAAPGLVDLPVNLSIRLNPWQPRHLVRRQRIVGALTR